MSAAETFLAEHPLTGSVDLLLPDLNGILRGKRLRADQLAGALAGECFFTISLYALDSTGTNVDRSGIVWEQGDPDRPVILDPDTLRPIPWRPGGAQVLGGVLDADGTPFFADPRHLVRSVAGRFTELGLTPVAALELEFHLLGPDLDPAGRPSAAPCQRLGGPGREVEVFLPDRLELIKGPPALRRAHLDQFVAALWPARSATRRAYAQALAQRNALISRVRNGAGSRSSLTAWDMQLARHGIALMHDRRQAAVALTAPFEQLSAALGLDGDPAIAYRIERYEERV